MVHKQKYLDNCKYPIIAIDFDGVINCCAEVLYPYCGVVRRYAGEVTNFMHKLGIIVVIWTSREGYHNELAEDFLNINKIHYDAINESYKFAPYEYKARKIYAHMYVDDRGYNWDGDDGGEDGVMLNILRQFLIKICGFPIHLAEEAAKLCIIDADPQDIMVDIVNTWKVGDIQW